LTTPTDPTRFDPPPISASAALFVDFDGTLAPLAPRPQDVQTPSWVVPALRRLQLALNGAVAVVSGRPIAQLDAFLAPLTLPSAGAHGAEQRGAAGVVASVAAVPPQHVVQAAHVLAQQHEGLILELKGSGFSLHYRARPELETTCRDALVAALAAVPGAPDAWEWLHGHFVFELKQRGISKGSAVRAFMAEPMFAGRLPIFIGDDVTDEDGIRAVQSLGGYGVRVGGAESDARYRLATVDAVAAWLSAAARDLPVEQKQDQEANEA
jgi:trehalose 6-phosphate phosphatase